MAKKSGLGKGLDALFLDNDTAGDGGMLLRLSDIEPNKNQPRKEFDEHALSELADSIREHGIIQPLLVRRLETGGYQLVAGERRWRAARMVGLAEVPAVIRDMSETEVMELGLIENLQREDLNPLEEAAGYKELMTTYAMTQEQVAKRVGKSRSAVANALRILNVPEEIRPFLISGDLTAGHAKALIGMEDRSAMVKLARTAAEKGMSVREVERLSSKKQEIPVDGAFSAEDLERERSAVGRMMGKNSFIEEMQLAMNSELARRVRIKPGKRDGGILEIAYRDLDDLKEIASRLAEED